MKKISACLALALMSVSLWIQAPSQAQTLQQRMLPVLREAGMEVPDSMKGPDVTPPARFKTGQVSGFGNVSGAALLFCSGHFMSGFANLTGSVEVRGDDGAHGSIFVSGSASLIGYCNNGFGSASGSARLSGSGPVYDAQGRNLGMATVSGTAFVTTFGPGGWINQVVSVSGYY